MHEAIKTSPPKQRKTFATAWKIIVWGTILQPKSAPNRCRNALGHPWGARAYLGALPGRSWDIPGWSQDIPRTLWDAPGTPLGRSRAFFGRLRASSEALLDRICSYIRGHAVAGSIWRQFFTIFAIAARIDFMLFSIRFC